MLRSLFRDRITDSLRTFYPSLPSDHLSELQKTLFSILQEHLTSSEATPSTSTNPSLFNERDVVLIAYPDHLKNPHASPLQHLASFCTTHLRDLVPTIHVLPYHTSTSYDGYSVVDYYDVDPKFGTWDDFDAFSGFSQMNDLVLNHCSASHPWFTQFLADQSPGRDYFLSFAQPPDWASSVRRARNLPLLYPHSISPRSSEESTPLTCHSSFSSDEMKKWVWCTYHPDLVDLNWDHPGMLIEWAKIILHSLRRGITWFRLDAFAYTLKRAGTDCVNLPECKVLLQLLKSISAFAHPRSVILPSITNVSQQENFGYLQHDADLVYCLPLSAMLLHALYSQQAVTLASWLATLPPIPEDKALLNLAASHDGIGLTWCVNLLTPSQLDLLMQEAVLRGGLIRYRKSFDDDDAPALPWEINMTFFSGCRPAELAPDLAKHAPHEAGALLWLDRFFLTQSVVLALQGVPALYLPLFFGAENDHLRVAEIQQQAAQGVLDPTALCAERAINRQRYAFDTEQASSPTGAFGPLILKRWQHMLRQRRSFPHFHPNAPQQVVSIDSLPSVLIILRQSTEPCDTPLLATVSNFAATPVAISPELLLQHCPWLFARHRRHFVNLLFDPIADRQGLVDIRTGLVVPAYASMWLAHVAPSLISLNTIDGLLQSCADQPLLHHCALPPQPPRYSPFHGSPAHLLEIEWRPRYGQYRVEVLLDREQLSARREQLSPDQRIFHLVRHGQAFHHHLKQLRGARSKKCPCYDLASDGTLRCPFNHPAAFDSFLTPEGIAEIQKIPADLPIQRSVVPPDTRCLHTVELLTSNPLLSNIPIFANELLRPLINPHGHAKRSSTSVLTAMFPQVLFDAISCEEDILFNTLMKDGHITECRDSIELRVLSFFDQEFSQPAQESLLVGHLSWFWAMIAAGTEEELFGTRQDHTQSASLFEFEHSKNHDGSNQDQRLLMKNWLLQGGPIQLLSILISKNN